MSASSANVPSTLTSKPCPVCGGQNPKLYYGGVCCLACKSFFIRAATGVYPHQCCTGQGNCDILPNELHNCKGCRYRRCIETGMNPNKVYKTKKYPEVVGQLENRHDLVLSHVAPVISQGFHFVAQVTYHTGPLQFARCFVNIDRSLLMNIAEAPRFSFFNLNVALPDVFLNSSLCFSKEEILDPSQEEMVRSMIPHGYCKFLASFIDFVSAIPELRLLSQADLMKLIQNNRIAVVALRAFYFQFTSPDRVEIHEKTVRALSRISNAHADQVQSFYIFYEQHTSALFTDLNMSEEESTLLRLVAVFWPFANCSDEGSDILRKARGKYLNILIGYHNESFPTATALDRLRRIYRLMDFLSKLGQFCEEINNGSTLLVINNTCNILGPLSYDVQVRVYSD